MSLIVAILVLSVMAFSLGRQQLLVLLSVTATAATLLGRITVDLWIFQRITVDIWWNRMMVHRLPISCPSRRCYAGIRKRLFVVVAVPRKTQTALAATTKHCNRFVKNPRLQNSHVCTKNYTRGKQHSFSRFYQPRKSKSKHRPINAERKPKEYNVGQRPISFPKTEVTGKPVPF